MTIAGCSLKLLDNINFKIVMDSMLQAEDYTSAMFLLHFKVLPHTQNKVKASVDIYFKINMIYYNPGKKREMINLFHEVLFYS